MPGQQPRVRLFHATVAILGILFGALLSAAPANAQAKPEWCKSDGTMSATQLPKEFNIKECDLRGRVIKAANGSGAVVPANDYSVTAYVLTTTGSRSMTVSLEKGVIEIEEQQWQPNPKAVRQARIDPCTDAAYNLEPNNWTPSTGNIDWYYYPGSWANTSLSEAAARSAVRFGSFTHLFSLTDCDPGGFFWPRPNVNLGAANGSGNENGDTNREPNIESDATCDSPDGVNVMGWKDMPDAGSTLAVTCLWKQGFSIENGDIAMRSDVNWWDPTDATCPAGHYDASSVAVHEVGHFLGLEHVEGTEHAGLSMYPFTSPCDTSFQTLGKGDHAGLVAKYPSD